MKYLIPLIIIVSVLAGIIYPQRYNVDSILSEYKAEYSSYKARVASIQKQIDDLWNNASAWERFKMRAVELAKQHDMPASVIIAQAAVESGRGTSFFARTRNNFFGHGAYDYNPNLAFSYESPDACILSHIRLLKSPRYTRAYANRDNPQAMVYEIKRAGYASDPNYVNKIIAQPEFTAYSAL